MMKKLTTPIAFFLSLLAFSFISCHDVIFDTIRGEVELADAKVSGDINSIVRFTIDEKEYLFADNGNIWKKDVTKSSKIVTATDSTGSTTNKTIYTNNPTQVAPYTGKWESASKSGIGSAHVIHLAADEKTLYALAGILEKNSDTGYNVPTSKTLYYTTDAKEWKPVTYKTRLGDDTDVTISAKGSAQLYCTNSPTPAHRKAYICLESTTIYELQDGVATQMGGIGTEDLATTPTTSTQSCAYFKDDVYFSKYQAMVTNESYDSETKTTTAPTYLYRNNGSDLYYIDSEKDPTVSENWKKAMSLSSDIYDLSCTSTHIVAGTKEGLLYVTLTNHVPTSKVAITNASSTLSSYYRVYNVIATDPTLGATAGDLYATTVFSGSTSSTGASVKNIGLWGFYPGRGNWNRE